MKKVYFLLVSTYLITLSACSPKVVKTFTNTYDPLSAKQEVYILSQRELVPANAEVLGHLKVGDTGFTTKCKYDAVINKIKQEARLVGGNAIQIIEHKQPDYLSSCHRITAVVLRVAN